MKKLVFLFFVILLVKCNHSDEQTEHFNDYLQIAFEETVEDQDSVLYLISGRGCLNCSKAALKYYLDNFKNDNYGTFIITNEAKEALDLNIGGLAYKCDTLNLLKRVDLPLEGITKLYIKDNKIDAIHNLSVNDLTGNHVYNFFNNEQ